MGVSEGYIHSEITDQILAVFYGVYNELGYGFLESVYRNALRLALSQNGFIIEQEVPVSVIFRGQSAGDFRAHLVVNGIILLELKTAEAIVRAHEAHVINYLRSTSPELGLILNFGPKPQVRRLLLDNVEKRKYSRSLGASN